MRGLTLPGTPDFGGDTPVKAAAGGRRGAASRKLVESALPVLQGWYARLRRDTLTRDASTVAAHLAFIYERNLFASDGVGGGVSAGMMGGAGVGGARRRGRGRR